MGLGVPETLGGYRVLERLGGGADAELFKARRDDGTVVCIKRLHPNLSDDPMFEQRFERELKLAQELRHRNIVEVSSHGHEEGYYFVMEYIDGPSLEVLLGAGVLSPPLVIYIGVELCRAFGFLHRTDPETGRKPTIHSDVTPHNILLGRDGGVKLSDFGLAKAISRTGAETITQARGKVTYLSPEQWMEQPVGSSTDLFS
ncbi:MAG TPA: serine/threonine protein kinase, partial [Polyangiaceae bacterium]|nr:serine/threonine protein kinase [Polyangiaceae bacterium]